MFIRPTNVIQFLKYSLSRLFCQAMDEPQSFRFIHPLPSPCWCSSVEMRGLEPLTSSLQRRRSPD